MHKLGVGNSTTLSDKENSVLAQELSAFHQSYYSANIMKLALVNNQSLAELKALATKHFSSIKNNNITL
ncbi:MAG: insulinase family protein [Colwellia sp.]